MTGTTQSDRPASTARPAGTTKLRALSLRRAPVVRIVAATLAGALGAGGAYAGIVAQVSGPMPRGQLLWTALASISSGLFAFLTTMAGGYAIVAMRTDQGDSRGPAPPVAAKPVWGSIPPRNTDFTDREGTLDAVRTALADAPEESDPRGCALVGLGGVGKTTIAAEFAYRVRREYSVVWWIRADQEATLIEDLGSLAVALNGGETGDSEDVITRLRHGLMSRAPWLLIFDNAESQSELRGFWPGGSAGSILLTSRNAVWEGLAAVTVPVDVLTTTDATALLRRRSGRPDDPAAAEVAERLGRLPLALAQAGSYVSKTKTSLQRYGALIDRQGESVLRAGLPGDYAEPVVTTWVVSFEAASRQSVGARELLALCAYLAATDIPRWLMTAGADELPEPLSSVARDPVAYDLAIGAQTQYSLLTADEDWLSMHRLVQLAVRSNLSPSDQRTWAGAAIAVLDRAFPADPAQRSSWPLCGELISHILTAAGHLRRLGSDSVASGRLLFRAGQYLVERGGYQEAVDALRHSHDVLSETVGPDSLEVAGVSRLLALGLFRLADLPHTIAMAERALSIHEQRLGPDNPEVIADLVELGRMYREMPRLADSRSALERALLLAEQHYGPAGPEVATVLQQLASTLWRIGHLGAARALLERALDMTRSGAGEPSTTEAATHRTLGAVTRDLRDFDAARHHLELSHAQFVAVDGPESVTAVRVQQTLSEVLTMLGDTDRAYDLITEALERLTVIYGADHPNVGEALCTDGAALNALGRPAEATRVLERAVAIYESSHGSDHPYVAGPLVPLATSYRLLGEADRAAETIERARRIVVASYGRTHPAYAVVVEELGRQAGDEEKAAGLAAEAAAIRERAEEVDGDN